jgi:hypothetical protein
MTARCIKVSHVATVVFLIWSAPISGQEQRPADSPSVKAEIGAAAAGFLPPARTYGVGVRLAKTINDRFSFEAELDWMDLGRTSRFSDQVIWLYFWQVKQMLVAENHPEPRFFVTYGTSGIAERTSAGGHLGSRLIPPVFPILGFGGQHAVGKHLIIRVDAQLIWFLESLITPRFSGGVSIPIGGK